MKINVFNGWFRGLGDIICYAWIGEGLLKAGQEFEFFAPDWRGELLRAFQLPVTMDSRNAKVANIGYETAVKEKSPLNYLEWIGWQLGLYSRENRFWLYPPAHPRLDLPPMERETGRANSARVLMFPHCYAPPRTWPKSYFIELGLMLRDTGIDLKVVSESRDWAFTIFHDIYNVSVTYIAAAIQAAELVIGNDSGPAHLAATIGTKALAIHGMTTERIYSYLPKGTVESFRKISIGCSGCHGLPPCRRSCDPGCMELFRTYPEEVFERVMCLLGEQQKAKAA